MSIVNILEIESKCRETLKRIEDELRLITSHRALPEAFSNLQLESGRLNSQASISNTSSTVVNIRPFDKNHLKEIESAVRKVGGYTISVRENTIYAELTPLYKEVVEKKIKEANAAKESAIIKLRNIRQDAFNTLKNAKKSQPSLSENDIRKSEKDIQKIIDNYTDSIKKITINL